LHAASAILRRLIATSGPPLACAGMALHAFPSAPEVGRASNAALLTAGLSAAKLATLRRVGEALSSGLLDETALQQCSSPEASARYARSKASARGRQPSSSYAARAARCFSDERLERRPQSSFVAGPGPLDIPDVLETLGSQRGMLYYHLLLARLEKRGDLGRASRYD